MDLRLLIFLCIVINAAKASTPSNQCPEGLLQGMQWTRFGRHCYGFLYVNTYRQEDAERYCRDPAINGTLAHPKTREVNDLLASRLRELNPQGRFFIGLDDKEEMDSWMWSDGTQFTYPDDFNRFMSGEGPRGNIFNRYWKRCATMDSSGVWRSVICGVRTWELAPWCHAICQVAVE